MEVVCKLRQALIQSSDCLFRKCAKLEGLNHYMPDDAAFISLERNVISLQIVNVNPGISKQGLGQMPQQPFWTAQKCVQPVTRYSIILGKYCF